MIKNQLRDGTESYINVHLEAKGLIICVLHGHITGSMVKKSMAQTAEYAQQVKANGQRPTLLIDASGVISQTSEARMRAKELGKMGLEKIAITGPSPALSLIIHYLMRSARINRNARVFAGQASARRWLASDTTATARDTKGLAIRISVTLLITAIAGAALAGWLLNNDILKALIPGLKAMNPVIALTLIITAWVIAGWHLVSYRVSKICTVLLIAWLIFFSCGVLAKVIWHIDFPVDMLLFKDTLNNGAFSGEAAPAAAALLLCVAIMLSMILTGQRKIWQRLVFHAASVCIIITTIFTILNYTFGFVAVLREPGALPLPFGTALCILLINHALQPLAVQLRFFAWTWQAFTANTAPIIVCAAMIIITGAAWQLSRNDQQNSVKNAVTTEYNKKQIAIHDRMAAYINTLRGYRSFFKASNNISPDDFYLYFSTLGLTENYPGFNAISFAPAVPVNQRAELTRQMRSQANARFPSYKNFVIFPQTNSSDAYPITLLVPSSATARYGFDLGSDHVRRDALETARDTGELSATGTIDLNSSRNDNSLPVRPGFFLSLPIYAPGNYAEPTNTTERRKAIYGFVNAVFENQRLFADIFKGQADTDVAYVVKNAATQEILYRHNPETISSPDSMKRSGMLELAGQRWQFEVYARPNFGLTSLGSVLPTFVLVGGGLLTLLATSLTLTQSRRRQQALQLAESMTEDLNNERNIAISIQQKDEAILSSIGDAVFAIDTKERITLFNPAAEKISGYSREEVLGRPYEEVLHFTVNNKVSRNFIRDALQGRMSSMKNNTFLTRKDGSTIAVADSAAPVHNAEGKLLGAIIVFRDISREYALDKAKNEFVSLASHQLRTPLSAIGWYAEMLINGDSGKLTKTQMANVRQIYEGNQRMVELVNAFLDVSRLDLGKLQNSRSTVVLTDIVQSTVQELAPLVAAKKLAVSLDIEPELPPMLVDRKLIHMIFQNLLSNAAKYTADEGKVMLELRHANQSDLDSFNVTHNPNKYFLLRVTDTGFGIPAAQQNKIFQKLFRADNVRVLDVEGTGLGLYIVKQVVVRLGGKIMFTSTEGKGTTFYVLMPFTTKQSSQT